MSNKTLDYYNQNAKEFINRTVDADMHYCQDKFIKMLETGAYILDAGCGSGRDSLYFLEHSFKVCAIDGSEEMCKAASDYIGQPVECVKFQDIDYEEMFD
jgi:ubiquinone/menaquinone biosynthesis C-methylase UbiE